MKHKKQKYQPTNAPAVNTPREFYLISVSLLIFLIGILATRTDIVDPDTSYHLMISRMMVESRGILRAVPQLDNMAWGTHFVDKEFFFHILTAGSYALLGDTGLKVLTLCLDLGIAWVLYSFLRRRTAASWTWVLLIGVFVAQATYMFRISAARPHVLAILLYLLNLQGVLDRQKYKIIVTSFLLPLAYHVLYLAPLNLVAGLLFYRDSRKFMWLGLGAFTLGVLTHPYFPDNIGVFLTQMQSGLIVKEIPAWLIPAEFAHPPLTASWQIHACFLALVGLVLWQRHVLIRLAQPSRREVYALMALTMLWYVTMLVNFRALEYAFPVWFLCFCALFCVLPRLRVVFLILAGGLLLFEVLATLEHKPRVGFKSIIAFLDDNKEAISHIPAGAAGKKVFNCFWNQGSQIFFHRPDMKLVDLLDPIFLFKHDRRLFDLRESLSDANEIDPYTVIAGAFQASYSLCEFGNLNMQLDLDPRFHRLTPQALNYTVRLNERFVDSTPLALYEIDEGGQRPFVTGLRHSHTSGGDGKITLVEKDGVFKGKNLKTGTFVKTTACNEFLIPNDVLNVKSNAVVVGVGGSLHPTILWNKQRLAPIRPSVDQAKGMLKEFVLLPNTLGVDDTMIIEICQEISDVDTLALSLWTPEDIFHQCQIKRNLNGMLKEVEFLPVVQAKFQYSSLNICAEIKKICASPTTSPSWCPRFSEL